MKLDSRALPAVAIGRLLPALAFVEWANAGGITRGLAVVAALNRHRKGDGVTLYPDGSLASRHTVDGRTLVVRSCDGRTALDLCGDA